MCMQCIIIMECLWLTYSILLCYIFKWPYYYGVFVANLLYIVMLYIQVALAYSTVQYQPLLIFTLFSLQNLLLKKLQEEK